MKLQFQFSATSCCLSNNYLDLASCVFQFYLIKLNGKKKNHHGAQQKVECSSGPHLPSVPTLSTSCAPTETKKKWVLAGQFYRHRALVAASLTWQGKKKRQESEEGRGKVASRESSNRVQEALDVRSHAAVGNDDDDAFLPYFSFGTIYQFLLGLHPWPTVMLRDLQWLGRRSLSGELACPVGNKTRGINKLHVGFQSSSGMSACLLSAYTEAKLKDKDNRSLICGFAS